MVVRALLALPVSLCLLAAMAGAEEVPVGIAKVDVTPDYPIRLHGFLSRKTESQGVRQPIWARALAIGSDTAGPAVLVTLDGLAIPDSLSETIAARLAKSGIQRERLALTATHTHSAPIIRDVAPNIAGEPFTREQQERIDRYTKELTDNIAQVALDALKNRAPAELSYAIGTVRFAKNRRTPGGPVDHDLPVLFVKSPEGKLRAIYTNYACHCVTLSDLQINGDWAGYAAEQIERQHPDAVALLSVGCGADSNPASGVTGSNAAVCEAQGVEIGSEVDRLLKGPLQSVPGLSAAHWKRIELALAPLPTKEEWEARAKQPGAPGYYARVQLEKLARGEALLTKISYPIQTWQFGEALAMVFLPGEVVVDYAKRLKSELDGSRLWINAYANACPGYVPSERILKAGGYEGGGAMIYYDLPAPYAPGLEQKIVDEVRTQLGDAYKAKVDVSRTQGSRPLTPQQSLTALKVKPGFRVDLIAAEPLLASPVAIEFGLKGELWVAEMFDYPAGVNGDYQPAGRVRRLTDSNDDGRYDAANVFLSGIPFPTGVTLWRDGLLVCAAPDILFARDTNGDGQADEVRKLFSGFGTDNYQARVNSLRYGLDGWVYGSCGLFGGTITSFTGKSLALGNRDFRIKPDTGEIEPVTGTTQQGRVRNDWGDWFGCNNSSLIHHYPVVDEYVRRNPFVAPPTTVSSVPAGADPGKLFPISPATLMPLSGPAGRVTAACGLEIYRDAVLGNEYRGDSFTCEPVNNLVHHLRLKPKGITFTGERVADEQTSEFLASTDPWFRPVQVRTGPDGGLWVVDMYRYVIEHPRWIPPNLVANLDVRAGQTMGRIYRVLPERVNAPKLMHATDWTQLSTSDLIGKLKSPNGWERDLAQQQLLWKADPAASAALKETFASAEAPLTTVQVLCTLDGLNSLEEPILAGALRDESPGVRRHALRIAARHWNEWPAPGESLAKSLATDDAQERLQLVYALGAWDAEIAGEILAQQLVQFGESDDLRAAILSSVNRRNVRMVLTHALKEPSDDWVGPLLSLAVNLGDDEAVSQALSAVLPVETQAVTPSHLALLGQLLDPVQRGNSRFASGLSEDVKKRVNRVVAQARLTVLQADAPEADRNAALRILARLPETRGADLDVLVQLLTPQTPADLQLAAVQSLGRYGTPRIHKDLLAQWASHTPSIRKALLEALLSRPEGQALLLDALEAGTVTATQFDAMLRQRLLQTITADLKPRAEKLLAGAVDANRQKVIDSYQDVATRAGDKVRGKAVFAKACAACHQLEGVGHALGQNIAALTNRTPQALLIAVLDPSRQLDERFVAYSVATTDGLTLNGLLANETSTSLTLRMAEGKEQLLLRTQIEELRSTGKSLMPEGLEKDLSKQDLTDLFAYIAQNGPPPKEFAGNMPRTITQEKDGSLPLPATAAQISGGDIVFEVPFQNVGYWHGERDQVAWTAEVTKPGEFDVWLDFSCADGSAGNRFVLESSLGTVTGTISATGGWDRYAQQKVGRLKLAAGVQQVVVRPATAPRGALADLRGLLLTPRNSRPRFTWLTANAFTVDPRTSTPADFARRLLDSGVPEAERTAIIASQPHLCAELISEMSAGLTFGTEDASKEEYRRIPWIWRVSIAAGKRNNPQQLLKILEVALPRQNEPLRDWQAVVIGGGVVNGLSQTGAWPRERISELLKDKPELSARWTRLLDQSAVMADDKNVPPGTRYDALRILGTDTWERAGKQLAQYLAKGTHEELQMGAVSGVSDVQAPEAIAALIDRLTDLPDRNRSLALDRLLRDETGIEAFLNAVAAGEIPPHVVGPDRVKLLREHATPKIRMRAREIWRTSMP